MELASAAEPPAEGADDGIVERNGCEVARPDGRHLGIADLVGCSRVDGEGEAEEPERG